MGYRKDILSKYANEIVFPSKQLYEHHRSETDVLQPCISQPDKWYEDYFKQCGIRLEPSNVYRTKSSIYDLAEWMHNRFKHSITPSHEWFITNATCMHAYK